MSETTYTPSQLRDAGIQVNQDGSKRDAFQVLSFPNVKFDQRIALRSDLTEFSTEIQEQIERDALYATYIERQKKDILALQHDEAIKIPTDFDYTTLSGLSNELKLKLQKAQPNSIANAARVEGMTPAALTLILARLRRGKKSA